MQLRNLLSAVAFFICIPHKVNSQPDLLLNGSLNVFEADSLQILDKTYLEQPLGVLIKFWEHNTCMGFYNPNYSNKRSTFLITTLFQKLGKQDAIIRNISGELCRPLTKGKSYLVSFYVKPYSATFITPSISVGFSDSFPETTFFLERKDFSKRKTLPLPVTSCFKNTPPLSDSIQLIQFTYRACGNEKYL